MYPLRVLVPAQRFLFMSVYRKHADSLRAVQNELGDDCPSFTFNGKTIRILPGGVRLKRENTPGGFSLDSDIQLTCLSADFAVQPQSKQTFMYLGRQFNIVSVTPAPGGLQLRINGDGVGKL